MERDILWREKEIYFKELERNSNRFMEIMEIYMI